MHRLRLLGVRTEIQAFPHDEHEAISRTEQHKCHEHGLRIKGQALRVAEATGANRPSGATVLWTSDDVVCNRDYALPRSCLAGAVRRADITCYAFDAVRACPENAVKKHVDAGAKIVGARCMLTRETSGALKARLVLQECQECGVHICSDAPFARCGF